MKYNFSSYCKPCRNQLSRDWQKRNPEKMKSNRADFKNNNPDYNYFYTINKKYGLSREDYNTLLRISKGACYLCGKISDKLEVDHNHKTGVVRGLLCRSCNLGLGNFLDNKDILIKAIEYLQSAESK